MPTTMSFDVTSKIDLQEVDNAINQARKELAQRYDFKGSKATIDFNAAENQLTLVAEDAFKMTALWEILETRLIRRKVPTRNFKPGEVLPASAGMVKREIAIQQGIDSDAAREIVKFLKDKKLKRVQVSIQGDQVRVASTSKDDLQEVIALLGGQDFGIALQFGNYR